MKEFLASLSASELESRCAASGFPKFRAAQIGQWLFEKLVPDPERMLNLPKDLRSRLKEEFFAPSMKIAEALPAGDNVTKLLLELHDHEHIEMAVIPAGDGRVTFCLSTQVGCPVGCRFCASGKNGFRRNLRCGEILEEFLLGCGFLGRRCDNIVFMGIGEGLLNCGELFPALERLTDQEGFRFAPRRITVSTSGYVPGMLKFAELEKEFVLAVSLHAPDDATRAKIIPDPLRFPVAEILRAADTFRERSGRLVTLEYTLLAGINDAPAQGEALGRLAFAHHAKINLIPYNATGGEFRRPAKERIAAFARAAAGAGAVVTCRVERGSGRSAACGQLRIDAERRGADAGERSRNTPNEEEQK